MRIDRSRKIVYNKIKPQKEEYRESYLLLIGNLTVSRTKFADGKIHRLQFMPPHRDSQRTAEWRLL